MRRYFERDVKNMKTFETPMAAGHRVVRPKEEDERLGAQDQTKYRSGVGSLLYLVKHTRPELSNSVRELSKVMDSATPAHMKDLYRDIKHVLDTENKELEIWPTKNKRVTVMAMCDSDNSGDLDTRKSVTGYLVFINGSLVAWRSRGQKTVSLSSCESEYYAMAEVAQELLYIKQILEFLHVEVELPMIVKCDNQGAIFLTKNESSTRTKHMDVRVHFIRELEGIIDYQYINSKDNLADVQTKNLTTEQFKKLSSMYMKTKGG